MTIFEAYNQTKKQLNTAGIEDYVFEAKQIIKHITGLSSAQILTEYNRPLTEYESNNLTALVHQRQIHYPLQYIFGQWDFYGRAFAVGPGVLIPRADTETVVEECLSRLSGWEAPVILDLCTGSGCIGITLAKEMPRSRVTLVDKYDEALRYAEKNTESNAAFNAVPVKGDVLKGEGATGEYDLIVSNPPYIPQSEMSLCSPEVAFEPETALIAAENGMEFYHAIVTHYLSFLKKGGSICLETGFSQSEAVARLLTDCGLTDIQIRQDAAGINRAVSGKKAD